MNNNCMSDQDKKKLVMRISWVSIFVNLLLAVIKIFAGFIAGSDAMISDGIHSSSDVFSTFVVIFGYTASQKAIDHDHPYGHERMECVAAVILALILAFVGLEIGIVGIYKVISGVSEGGLNIPGALALWVAVISVVIKEAMFWYTRHGAKKIASDALMADAWHHRSDSLSSVGSFIGILGARLGFPILDPIASVVICVFVLKAAFDIFIDAIKKMVDEACDDETTEAISSVVKEQEGVMCLDEIRTRVFGNKVYVDIEIGCDGRLPLVAVHAIAENVHGAVEGAFPNVKHCMVHVNPVVLSIVKDPPDQYPGGKK